MSEKTNISWCDSTWNPISGCSKVSPGCTSCYAMRETNRHRNLPKYAGLVKDMDWTGEVRWHPELLDQPLHWSKPRRIFVNSMSDTFHDKVPKSFQRQMFDVMEACPQHIFQVLTKRPGQMAYFANPLTQAALGRPGWTWPANVWAGTSVESQKYAPRIDCLLRVPAKVRFVSAEPLLSALDLRPYFHKCSGCGEKPCACKGLAINWVIVGGESGPGARPFNVQWGRDLVEQCHHVGASVFIKQLGRHPCFRLEDEERRGNLMPGFHHSHGDLFCKKLKDPKGGDMAEWPEDLRVREFPRDIPVCSGAHSNG